MLSFRENDWWALNAQGNFIKVSEPAKGYFLRIRMIKLKAGRPQTMANHVVYPVTLTTMPYDFDAQDSPESWSTSMGKLWLSPSILQEVKPDAVVNWINQEVRRGRWD